MTAEDIRRQILRFDPKVPIEGAWTPPASWYTDPEIFELERRVVFANAWQPAGRLDQLVQPGQFLSGCRSGEPWVVLRDQARTLRAFINVCRHKGHEVARGQGLATELVCGYHAWTYGLDGALKSAPKMAGIQEFDRQKMSLPAMGAEGWGPWVFIHSNPSATRLIDSIFDLDQRLQATAWERLQFVDRRSFELDCNWKVYVDNYLDGGYHIPHRHPSLDAQLDMDSYRTEVFGRYSIQTCQPNSTPDPRLGYDVKERLGPGAIYAWIWPNFMLNRYGPCLDSNHVVPIGPDRCRVDYEFYFLDPPAQADGFVEQSIAQSAVTQREDMDICASVQLGLRSGAYDQGRYAPRVEMADHHFHRLLQEALLAALAEGA